MSLPEGTWAAIHRRIQDEVDILELASGTEGVPSSVQDVLYGVIRRLSAYAVACAAEAEREAKIKARVAEMSDAQRGTP